MRPRVKEVLTAYADGGILGVKEYYNQDNMSIDPSTWSGEINKLITNNNLVYASAQIEMLSDKFNL